MTKSEQPKPVSLPLLLVYGKPTSPDIPQASWFRAEDGPGVTTAAQTLKFAVIDIKTEADRALIDGVHEGVVKAGGRLIVGSVAVDVYQRIEDHTHRLAGQAPAASSTEIAGAKSLTEQSTNTDGKDAKAATAVVAAPSAPDAKTSATASTSAIPQPSPAPARDPWDALRIGSYVAVKHWEVDGEPYGWWIAIIKDIDKGDYIVRWMDDALKPAFKIERKHIALLHPSFDVTREWEKRR